MKIFTLDENYSVVCEAKKTRNGFKHEAKLCKQGEEISKAKICYLNRTWESFEYESVLNNIVNSYFEETQAKKYLKDIKIPENKQFKTVNMVCALGKIICNTEEEKNNWDKKMLGTIKGIEFPKDFDNLPEEEKQQRLKGALETLNLKERKDNKNAGN